MKAFNFMAYNTDFKIAGNTVTFKTYSNIQFYNYTTELNTDKNNLWEKAQEIYREFIQDLKSYRISSRKIYLEYIKKQIEEKKKERFIKSLFRARQNIFDLIQCNTGKWLDYEGKKQTTKFLTLTFKDEIKDITKANQELTKFFKRLSYHQFGIRKNVIKYIAVPELQKRGVWHFHIILFNAKYTPFKDLIQIWGQGGVYINALRRGMNGTEIAKYITKYISKGMGINNKGKGVDLGNYETYKKYGMENKKRYTCSRGLHRPFTRKLKMETQEATMLAQYLFQKTEKKESIYFREYENEYRGQVQIVIVELPESEIRHLKQYLDLRFSGDMEYYKQEYFIDWEKIRRMREKQIQDMILYDIEKYYEYELSRYQKITGLKVG